MYAVQEDNQGFLWISTDAGISQFNKHNHKFINYYVSDGLQGNEFSKMPHSKMLMVLSGLEE